jgi:hypothetical protein
MLAMELIHRSYEPQEAEELWFAGVVIRRLPALNAVEVALIGREPTDTIVVKVSQCWTRATQNIPD